MFNVDVLVGKSESEATAIGEALGYRVRVKNPTMCYTAEFNSNRINLYLDEAGIVTKATIG